MSFRSTVVRDFCLGVYCGLQAPRQERTRAAAAQRKDPKHLDKYVIQAIAQERAGMAVETTLVLRHDGAKKLVPLVLVTAGTNEMVTSYTTWYPDIRVYHLPATLAGKPAILTLAEDPLVPPSKRPDAPLVGLDEAFWQAVAALRSGKHVVLVGPPGTGKTDLAEYICHALIKSPPDHFDFATATSEWTTFDTIGGYLPLAAEGSLDFTSGIITQAIESSRWLVIDELNRADIDKAFGELFTLLSRKSVRLPFRKRADGKIVGIVLGASSNPEDYAIDVAETWRIVATMNSFDKASLFQLSYAFMRRFAFVDVPIPADDVYRDLLRSSSQQASLPATSHDLLLALFVPDPGEGLGKLGLRVGPAIPLDVIRYLAERLKIAGAVPEAIAEGLELLLFPQLEGQDRRHTKIVETVSTVLNLTPSRKAELGRRLTLWTGYEKGA